MTKRRHPAEKLMDPAGQKMLDWTFRGMVIIGLLMFCGCVYLLAFMGW
jgi:hypothetical protein